ncbi:leucine-rich repeat flightless-interacting protein 1 isoform X13 [Pezoporus flaviventris]|uniref:leucine-rich repeat flightless-interacting protein 1 isoform X13 n=1 Tax=Pezoporus flaviventris TaxID=889875 RepID=UPI002AB01895|nr:leucine-rich repeat flightless-interacting protein 1 isoform X13 [Pezoporus flaviventris]
MGTQGAGRKRLPNRERLTAEDDALNQIAREAEARLAAKRAARAEAREIRMKELERQQKEEDSERYSRRARRNASASDEDEHMSVGSRGSLRSHLEHANIYPVAGLENERTKKKNYSKATNGYEDDVYGSSQSRKSSRASYYSDLGLHNSGYASTSQPSSQNGNWPSLLCSDAPARSYRASVYDESVYSGSRRYSASSSRAPSEYSCYLGSGSRASSRASSARASPVIEERPEKDFEKGARTVSSLSAATLASLGGTSSRRGSGDTSISADTEASIREIKDIYELKNQIQDVEGKYMQGLKEMKDSLAEVEEKYKKAMVSNAQLDNEKTNFMYQVDTLKDALLELEEQLAESRRQYEEKSKEFEREKHAHSILQFQFMEIKEALKQREEMLAKHGIIPDSDVATNGETSDILDNEEHLDSSKTVPGTTLALKTGGDGMLGKASEVDMKNEILEDMGKREILQNTEHEEHKEESEEQELHAGENAKAQKMVEESDALSTVMLPDSRFTVQIQSLTEHVSGSTSSSDDNGADDLRKVAESAGTAVQQPVSTEAEHCDLNAVSNQNLEVGSLQSHQMFDPPQEMHSDLGTEHELEKAAPQQQDQEDLKSSHVLSDNEMDQEAKIASESCELASNQAGLPEVTAAGLISEELKVESHTEALQHSEESAENQVTSVLEEKFVEGQDSTDGRAGETGDRSEQKNEVGNTVQGQSTETEPVGLEGMEACGSGVPAAEVEKDGGGHQAFIQSVSPEGSPSASSEKQNMQYESELENAMAEKDGQKEALTEELEMCSDSAETGKQDKISVEAVDFITEVEGSVLQQAEPDREIVMQVMTRETSFDPSLLDDRIKESELETGDESGTEKESRTEWVEDTKLKVGVQTVQSSEEAIGETVGEKNTPFEGEAQNVAEQEEGESKEESTVDVSVATGKKVYKETLGENEQELELADHHGGGCTSEESVNNSLAQKAESDANVSEHIILEDQAKGRLEGGGDVFDFDEESKQILETDKKCDEEKAYTQKYEDDGTKGAAGKTAQTDEAGEGKGKIETEDILTKADSLQQKKADEPEETGEASWRTEEKTDVMEDEIKASDSKKVEKIPDETVMEQDLESAGNNREESNEDLQSGRRGKGRSRDDCTIS